MQDTRLIKSYVWHGKRCFFASTADRDSSAMLGPTRFSETLVWDFDWDTNERGSLLFQSGTYEGSIRQHLLVCERIFKTGNPEVIEE